MRLVSVPLNEESTIKKARDVVDLLTEKRDFSCEALVSEHKQSKEPHLLALLLARGSQGNMGA